jgi:hypothetical protein
MYQDERLSSGMVFVYSLAKMIPLIISIPVNRVQTDINFSKSIPNEELHHFIWHSDTNLYKSLN